MIRLLFTGDGIEGRPITDDFTGWLYLGRDAEVLDSLDLQLGTEKRIDYKHELTAVSERLRRPFVEWMAEINVHMGRNPIWLNTELSSRGTLTTSVFLSICWMISLREVMNRVQGPILVVSDSLTLLHSIEQNFTDVRWKKRHRFKARVKAFLSSIYIVSADFLRLLETSRTIKRLSATRRKSIGDVVIHTCVNERSFRSGRFFDPYFVGLQDYLLERGYSVSTAFWIEKMEDLSWAEVYAVITSQPGHFFSIFEFVDWKDLIIAWYCFIRSSFFRIPDRFCAFEDLSLELLLSTEIARERMRSGKVYFFLWERFFRRLKRAGNNVGYYVSFWEYHYYNASAIKGIRSCFPDARVYVCQTPLLVPIMYMGDYSTTREEQLLTQRPDVYFANSKTSFSYFLDEGFDEKQLAIGPSFRHKSLVIGKEGGRTGKNCLFLMPLLPTAARHLLQTAVELAREAPIPIFIRFHPTMGQREFLQMKEIADLGGVSIHEGTLEEALAETKVAVISDSTGMVEVCAQGIPTIVLLKPTDLDVIPFFTFRERASMLPVWYARSADEVRNCLPEAMAVDGWRILKDHFHLDDFAETKMSVLDPYFPDRVSRDQISEEESKEDVDA